MTTWQSAFSFSLHLFRNPSTVYGACWPLLSGVESLRDIQQWPRRNLSVTFGGSVSITTIHYGRIRETIWLAEIMGTPTYTVASLPGWCGGGRRRRDPAYKEYINRFSGRCVCRENEDLLWWWGVKIYRFLLVHV